jgi:hypothetical protein
MIEIGGFALVLVVLGINLLKLRREKREAAAATPEAG